jgi:hypothetical protein
MSTCNRSLMSISKVDVELQKLELDADLQHFADADLQQKFDVELQEKLDVELNA